MSMSDLISFLMRAITAAFLVPTLAFGGVLASPAQAQKIKPDFFGMHDFDWTSAPSVPVGSANLTTSGTYWTSVQPSAGTFDWTRLDAQVAGARRKGAQPMIVLGFSPTFASTKPGSDNPRVYMPKLKLWKRYVSAVARRYGRNLDYQIWPEPNIGENWLGTPRQMAKLTAVASKAIDKHAGRRAKVVSPAVALRLEGQRQWMVKFFRQKIGGKPVHRYIDVVALDPFPALKGTPEDSLALVEQARRKLARLGVRKPLWNNEINYGIQGGGDATGVRYPAATQRAYVIRTFALMAAARVQRTYWLGWFSNDTLGVSMAEVGGKALPAGKAYSLVRKWLIRTDVERLRKLRNGVWMITAKKSRREVRRIYWKPRGQATVTTPRGTKRVVNQNGATVTKRSNKVLRVNKKPVLVVSRS